MEFLEPHQERAQRIRLFVGYFLIGVAVLIGTLVLLYSAYGFGLGRDGQVVQNGLVFLSSQPDRAQIYLDNKLYRDDTNAKLQLPAGQYGVELRRDGYDSWKRLITVEGSSVLHVDYPKLFPTKLTTTDVKSYAEAPGLATQSPDRRWMIVQQPASITKFDLYDLADYKKITTNLTQIALPDNLLTSAAEGTHTLELDEWSTDNRRVVLTHEYTVDGTAGTEYILLDKNDPESSLNLTRTLGLGATQQLTLLDKKYNQYYIYDTAARTLGTTSIDTAGTIAPLLDAVVSFKTYGRDIVLYVTDKGAPVGQVSSLLYDDGQTYKIRDHGINGPFLVDLAKYEGGWFVVAGASGDSKVYVYRNPQQARKTNPDRALTPVQILRITAPNRIQFSSNVQYIMAANGSNFVTYDVKNNKGYSFDSRRKLDTPAPYATWMDTARIHYVSEGKVVAFDYDNLNDRALVNASANYLPMYDRDYDMLYTFLPGANNTMVLKQTPMLTSEDL